MAEREYNIPVDVSELAKRRDPEHVDSEYLVALYCIAERLEALVEVMTEEEGQEVRNLRCAVNEASVVAARILQIEEEESPPEHVIRTLEGCETLIGAADQGYKDGYDDGLAARKPR